MWGLLFLRCIIILNDTSSTLQGWAATEVAWGENKHEKLSQDGILEDEKDARLMEHVCWSLLCTTTEGALTAGK